MRCVHGDRPRPRGALVHDAGEHRERCRDHHARGARHSREAAPDSAGVHRRAGRAVRLLPERRHHDRQSVPRSEPARHRRAAAAGAVERAVPLRRQRPHDARDSPLRVRFRQGFGGSAGDARMKTLTPEAALSRREFIARSGALIVTFSAVGLADQLGLVPGTAAAQGINGNPATQLDAWIAVGADGRITAYTGKCELGQGLFTAQTQLVAEELSVPIDRVTLIMCDTDRTPDQGTTSGAQSHPANFNQANLALAGATAREALLQMASTRLTVPVDQLVARDGAVQVGADAARRVSYGDLVGGRTFNLPLNRQAKRKHPSTWTVLGTPVK